MGKPPRKQHRIQSKKPQAKTLQSSGIFSRRKFLLGSAAAAASALGAFWGWKGIEALRFSRWKRNQSLTVLLGDHQHATDATLLANAFENARQAGRPFDFLVLENYGIKAGKRKIAEESYKNRCSEVRKNFAKELEQNNIKPIIQFLKEKYPVKATPGQADFQYVLMALAAKHGLRLKFAEEYSPREIQTAEAYRKRLEGLTFGRKDTLSTSAILEISKQAMVAEEKFMQARNQKIASISSRAAAELRQEHPELRKRELKGAVQAGARHFGIAEEIKRLGIRKLNAQTIVDSNENRHSRIAAGTEDAFGGLVNGLFAESKAKGRALTPEQIALAFITEPVYATATKRDLNKAAFLEQLVFRQTPQSSAKLLSQLQGLEGKERITRMLELMTGEKVNIIIR